MARSDWNSSNSISPDASSSTIVIRLSSSSPGNAIRAEDRALELVLGGAPDRSASMRSKAARISDSVSGSMMVPLATVVQSSPLYRSDFTGTYHQHV